jgi:ASC-1-like (ASCH) protein
MIHKKHVSEPYFTFIKKGIKTIEGRLNKGSFTDICIGDTVIWFTSNSAEQVKTKIVKINKYDSFYKYLKKEKLKHTLPNVKNIEDGVAIYYKFYTHVDEHKYGVLAIHIKLFD